MITIPCTWFGITVHASNDTFGRTTAVRCHSSSTIRPAGDRRITPPFTRPSDQRRSRVQIVTKYTPGAA